MVLIVVSDYIKGKLEAIKEAEGHKSLDSVIRVLLIEREKEKGKEREEGK